MIGCKNFLHRRIAKKMREIWHCKTRHRGKQMVMFIRDAVLVGAKQM